MSVVPFSLPFAHADGGLSDYESGILIWGTVESAVTIIAVSVPFLRILVVEARSPLAPQHRRFFYQRKLVLKSEPGDEHGLVFDREGNGSQSVMMTPSDTASQIPR